MYQITKQWTFEAAHQLHDPAVSAEENERLFGKCSRLHGHSYKLEVTVACPILRDGMVMNFETMSLLVKREVITPWDHRFLNELKIARLTTAEEMVSVIWVNLRAAIHRHNTAAFGPNNGTWIKLEEITLWETRTSKATIQRSR